MLYGQLLKTLRKRKGFSSQQVADFLHVSRSTYSRYENNLKSVEEDVLKDMAEFYGTTAEDFKEWNGYMKEPDYPYNVYRLCRNKKSDE